MAWKYHIDVGAGVIDADYRGNVGVVLFNLAQKPYEGTVTIAFLSNYNIYICFYDNSKTR